jgi:hypothetical protein
MGQRHDRRDLQLLRPSLLAQAGGEEVDLAELMEDALDVGIERLRFAGRGQAALLAPKQSEAELRFGSKSRTNSSRFLLDSRARGDKGDPKPAEEALKRASQS